MMTPHADDGEGGWDSNGLMTMIMMMTMMMTTMMRMVFPKEEHNHDPGDGEHINQAEVIHGSPVDHTVFFGCIAWFPRPFRLHRIAQG